MTVFDYKNVRFEGEESAETTLVVLRAHPITNLNWILAALFACVSPLLLYFLFAYTVEVEVPLSITSIVLSLLVWYLIVVGVSFQRLLIWYFNIYILTDKRIVDIDFVGLFHRQVSQTTLSNVQDVTFAKAGLLQNFFDYGNLHLQTAGTAMQFEFFSISDPEGNQKKILDLIANYKRKHRGL